VDDAAALLGRAWSQALSETRDAAE
jgi:hypothetical protein